MHIRLMGVFTLRSPLSHIRDTDATHSYLAQEPILQPDGQALEVFAYAGNSWRGILRDKAADYMLDRLGSPQLPTDIFHFLYSGGEIGGEQIVDIEGMRQLRRLIPMASVWGGGLGNRIAPGKLRVGNCYPLCWEALPALPELLHDEARRVSYSDLTFEKNATRTDDSKDPRRESQILALPATAQAQLLDADDDAGSEPEQPTARPEKKGPSTQMIMTNELLIAGTKLATRVDLMDVNELELGAFVSAVHRFSRSPHLGGKSGSGHGQVELDYRLLDVDTGEYREFIAIKDGPALLSPFAAAAKDAYDQYLRRVYDEFIADRAPEMMLLLKAQKAA